MRSELIPALPWLGAAVPLVTSITVLSGALDGRQQFITSNLLRLIGECTYQVIPLVVAVVHGPHLAWLLSSAVLARVFSLIVLFIGCWKHVPLSHSPSMDTGRMREVLLFGGWATLSGLLYPLLKTVDQFIIGILRGPTAVTFYTIPYQFATKLIIIPNSIVRSLFPRLAMRNPEGARDLAQQSLSGMIALTTPLCVLSILAVGPFFKWWLGPDVARSSSLVAELLVIGAWLTGCIALCGKLLVAQGRPDLVAKVQAAELVPFLTLLWIAVSKSGIQGAAVIWVTRSAAEVMLLSWLAAFSWRRLSSLLMPIILLLAAVLCAQTVVDGRLHLALGSILFLITCKWSLRNGHQSAAKKSRRRSLEFNPSPQMQRAVVAHAPEK